jgi:hypothetical protein
LEGSLWPLLNFQCAVSIEASPPIQPPQMSPDKKWFWDGAAWRPIPVHEAAFPNWQGVGAGFSPEAAQPAQAYRIAAPAPGVAAPRWSQAPRRLPLPRAGMFAAAVAGLVAVVALVSVFGTLALSNRPAVATPRATATPTPGPADRSASAQAAFIVKTLTSPMADLKDTTSQTRTSCAAGMTSSCADNLTAIGTQSSAILAMLDRVTTPLCLTTYQARLHTDLTTMNNGTQLALKGFHDNKKSEFSSGLSQVNNLSGWVQTEFVDLRNAAPACETQVTGP